MSTEMATATRTKLKVPSLYKVVIHNDNYTPMEFVVRVLVEIFSKSTSEADALATQVHEQGRGIVATYTKEIAEQKVAEVSMAAERYSFPLKTTAEVA